MPFTRSLPLAFRFRLGISLLSTKYFLHVFSLSLFLPAFFVFFGELELEEVDVVVVDVDVVVDGDVDLEEELDSSGNLALF